MMHNNGIDSIPVFCVDFFDGGYEQAARRIWKICFDLERGSEAGYLPAAGGEESGQRREPLQQASGLWRSEHEGKERNGGCDMVNKKIEKACTDSWNVTGHRKPYGRMQSIKKAAGDRNTDSE